MAETLKYKCSSVSAITLMICIAFSAMTFADTDVYVTRDASGNPVFSDTPSSDSEKIIVDELQTIPKTKADVNSLQNHSKLKELPKYNKLEIVSPAHDSAIRDNSGALSVSVSLKPGLRGNDQLVIYMDGKEISKGSATSVSLNSVDRGTHNLTAEVLSSDGKSLIKSAAVTVHLLRVSVQ